MTVDLDEAIKTVWNALHDYRENCIPENASEYDDQWESICSAMANITENLTISKDLI